MHSQADLSSVSIYISAGEANLEIARLVQTQLEGEGFHAWLGDAQAQGNDPQNIQKLVDDALQLADARALIILDGGDLNKLEAARKRKIPIFALKVGDSLNDILIELNQIAQPAPAPVRVRLPAPAHPISAASPATAAISTDSHALRLLVAVLLNLPTLLVMVFVMPNRTVTLGDWFQLLILSAILAVAGWAYSDQGR